MEARLIANPSTWEEERAKRVKAKIDKERESRIRGKTQVSAKVNRRMAEKILDREEKNERRRAQRVIANGGDEEVESIFVAKDDAKDKGLLGDSRFARLFQDEDFTVDETSREFQSLNPSTNPSTNLMPTSNQDREKRLTVVEQEMIDTVPGSSSDEDEAKNGERDGQQDNRISSANYKRRPQPRKQKSKQVQMRVTSSSERRPGRERSFGSRATIMKPRDKQRTGSSAVGEKMLSFEPQSGRKDKGPRFDRNESGANRSFKDRRSASGNAFRRM